MPHLTFDPLVVAKKLAADLGLDNKSTAYLLRRIKNEGLKFLTKTLPKLSKALLASLEKGFFQRPKDFRWKGASLEFCSSWLNLIFNRRGILRNDACPYAIKNIRQLCEYFYKLVTPFSEKDIQEAEDKYVELEQGFPEASNEWADEVRITFENLYPNISRETPDGVFQHSRPRFGPGSYAGSQKCPVPHHIYKNKSDSIIGTTNDTYSAYSGYFKPYASSKTPIKTTSEGKTSEVVIVPKDSRGPRIISKEPLHLLKGQMAFFDWLSSSLQFSSRKRINFTDQTINQNLAREGSIKQNIATLDLKDASDRMGFSLARRVFRNSPALRWFVLNARSTHTVLPSSGKIIPLKKLSGMGSGLTFPIMALLIQCSVVTSVRKRVRHLSLKDIAERVYVYGDDIIIPKVWYDIAVDGLCLSGFKVNTEKSYRHSHFRESCGGDYYKGVSVGPVRLKLSNNRSKLRSFAPNSTFTVVGDAAILQLERHCRELVRNGFPNLSEFFYRKIEYSLKVKLPPVSGDSPVLGRYEITAPLPNFSEREVLVPSAVTSVDVNTCPYKYLSRFFNKVDDSVRYVFGELSRPRAIKLQKRVVTYLATVINS